jgi:hypothetical protein
LGRGGIVVGYFLFYPISTNFRDCKIIINEAFRYVGGSRKSAKQERVEVEAQTGDDKTIAISSTLKLTIKRCWGSSLTTIL